MYRLHVVLGLRFSLADQRVEKHALCDVCATSKGSIALALGWAIDYSDNLGGCLSKGYDAANA